MTAASSTSGTSDFLTSSTSGKSTRLTCFTSHEFLNHLTSTTTTTSPCAHKNDSYIEWLPKGWKVGNRRRSLLELETNIQTLGELYRALSDIRTQLPSPVAAALEETTVRRRQQPGTTPETPVVASMTEEGRQHLHLQEEISPVSLLGSPGTFDRFAQQLSQYPLPVFDALMRLHLDCTSYHRTNRAKFLQQYHQGLIHPGLVCAIYAYTAIHAVVCHPEQFGIYPFMDQLARDAYHLATELVEFDHPSKSTVETLVLMHLYLVATTGAPQQNYLSVAEMHMMALPTTRSNQNQHYPDPEQDTHRLLAWMHQHDLLLAMRTLSPALLRHPSSSLHQDDFIQPLTDEERLPLDALRLELEGLEKIIHHQDLNSWRDTIQARFPFHGHGSGHPQIIRYALRLHAIYFTGMLQLHQSDMMAALAASALNDKDNPQNWIDYFHHPSSSSASDRVESALMDSMRAGFGLVQTIGSLLQTNDRCLMMELIDTLATAYSILYYGNKMLECPIVACQDAMVSLLEEFASSSSMMQSSCMRQFVQRWQCVLSTADRKLIHPYVHQ